MRHWILLAGLLVVTACGQRDDLQQVGQRFAQFPQSAVVLGTVARATPSGIVGSESGKGSVIRFDTELLDPLTPGIQKATAWAGGVPKPMRFHFSVPSDTIVMPGRYALTTVTDALGYTSNLESPREFYRPLWFDIAPGEVVYIGDIRFAPDPKGLRLIVTDRWDEYVRMHKVPPALLARVHKRILQVPEVLPIVTENVQPRQ